jgi:hypothetical protein
MAMKIFIHILAALSSSFLISCASTTKSVLEERAGYNNPMPQLQMSNQKGARLIPKRVPEKVIVAWLHPHELPSKDYFWGSWISIVVVQESWEMVKTDLVNPPSDVNKKSVPSKNDKPAVKQKIMGSH